MLASEFRAELEQRYESREAAVEDIARIVLGEWGGHGPDILTVTAGYIEELAAQRVTQPMVVVTPKAERSRTLNVRITVPVVPLPTRSDFVEPSLFFDRKRQPISEDQYVILHADEGYTRLALEVLEPEGCVRLEDIPDRKKAWLVSTVWLGMNRGLADDPIIFSTIIWRNGEWGDEWTYHTEAEALEGHSAVVAQQRAELAELNRKRN